MLEASAHGGFNLQATFATNAAPRMEVPSRTTTVCPSGRISMCFVTTVAQTALDKPSAAVKSGFCVRNVP